MLVFPQLTTGGSSQYPLSVKRTARTVVNRMADGSEIRYADQPQRVREWELPLRGLIQAEADSVTSLFAATEGSLTTFLLLDPAANLLSFSEDLTASAWHKDPALVLTAGVADPLGTSRATRIINSASSRQMAGQNLANIPGSFTYAFSAYVRSGAAATVSLLRVAGTSVSQTDFAVGPAWSRLVSAGSLNAAGLGLTFSLLLGAVAQVDVFGLQVEAQPAPSEYKRNRGVGGVYLKARFAADELQTATLAPDQISTTVRIRSMEE